MINLGEIVKATLLEAKDKFPPKEEINSKNFDVVLTEWQVTFANKLLNNYHLALREELRQQEIYI